MGVAQAFQAEQHRKEAEVLKEYEEKREEEATEMADEIGKVMESGGDVTEVLDELSTTQVHDTMRAAEAEAAAEEAHVAEEQAKVDAMEEGPKKTLKAKALKAVAHRAEEKRKEAEALREYEEMREEKELHSTEVDAAVAEARQFDKGKAKDQPPEHLSGPDTIRWLNGDAATRARIEGQNNSHLASEEEATCDTQVWCMITISPVLVRWRMPFEDVL